MTLSLDPLNASKPQDSEIQDGKLFAAIGYLSFLCFVPLAVKKENKFCLFHAKQALVLFIFELAAGMFSVIPALGDLVSRFALVVFGILSLVGVLKVLMEEYWEMPVIYDIARRMTL